MNFMFKLYTKSLPWVLSATLMYDLGKYGNHPDYNSLKYEDKCWGTADDLTFALLWPITLPVYFVTLNKK